MSHATTCNVQYSFKMVQAGNINFLHNNDKTLQKLPPVHSATV